MKKTVILFTLLSLVSCVRESMPVGPESRCIRASIVDEEAVTKSILIDNPGLRMVNKWQDGDAIGIFGQGSDNQRFSISAASLSVDGKSADFIPSSDIPRGSLQGYSPFKEGTTRSGDALIMEFPSLQHGAATELDIERPDPSANILVADGNAGNGLLFRPVMSVLKIGQVFQQETQLRAVEFRDLSGAPVAGSMRVTGGNSPKAEITGSGKVVTLSLAQDLTLAQGALRPLFMIVPAREYAKGFELTFIDSAGNRTVRTIGTRMGKTLQRGVVYAIGDIPAHTYQAGVVSKLSPGSQVITPEKADMIRIIKVSSDALMDTDGVTPIKDEQGHSYFRPSLDMMVHKDMNPAVGQRYIFDYGSPQFPQGGIFTITGAEKLNADYYRVYAKTEPNIAAAFDELTAGGEMYDSEGNEIEGAGIPLDFASYVTDILDSEGNSIPFSVSPEGQLLFSEEATTQLTGIPTKASSTSKSLTSPTLSMGFSEKNATVGFSSSMSIDFRVAVGYFKNEVQYVYYKVHPTLKLSVDFSLKADFDKSISKTLITFVLAPIPLAPGVIILPEVQLVGKAGISGSIAFSASVKRSFDLGSVGFAYNKGDGFNVRTDPPDPGEEESFSPTVGGVSGSLGAYGSLSIRPYVSLYGLFGLGVDMDLTLFFGLKFDGGISKVALVPSLSFAPRWICLGGYYTNTIKKFQATFEFDPLWERYLTPQLEQTKPFYPVGPTRTLDPFYYTVTGYDDHGEPYNQYVMVNSPYDPNGSVVETKVFTQFDGVSYGVSSTKPTLEPWIIYLEVVSGTVRDLSWNNLLFDVGVYIGGDYAWDNESIKREKLYRIMTVPMNSFDELKAEGTAGNTSDFVSGTTYGFRIVAMTASGKTFYPNIGAMYKGRLYPFTFFWPETPDGPYFVEVYQGFSINGLEKREKGSEKEPDGYFGGF